MPTKLNKAGKQQPYVPKGNGDASGEYGNHTGSNKHFQTFGKKEITNFGKKEFKGFSSNNKIVNEFRDTVIKNKLAKLKEKGEQQIDNINLDLSQPISKITDLQKQLVYEKHPKEVVDLAAQKIQRYEPIVDNIANDILSSTTQQGGLMIGLDFRLKRLESLSRKIQSDVLEAKEKGETLTFQDAVNKMGDVARFTACFDPQNFQQSADKVLRDLQAKGYEITKFKNSFQPGSSYKGLNCNLKDKNGNIFELQFHTPDTMKIKEGYDIDIKNRKAIINKATMTSHDIYETTRVIEDNIRKGKATPQEIAQLDALKKHSVDIWNPITYNFDNWTIDNYKAQPKINKPTAIEYARNRDGLTKLGKTYKVNDEFFAYKDDRGRWYITDRASGLSAAGGKTRKEALDQFNKRTEQIKIAKSKPGYQEQVKKFQELKKGTQ